MKSYGLVAIVLMALVLAALAQQGDRQPSAKQELNAPLLKPTVKFETTTQLVIVNVVVKDKDGRPIENLKASDFTVFEDGKPQQIKVFEYQRLEDAPLPPPAKTFATRPEDKPQEAELPQPAPRVTSAVQSTITPAKPGEIKYKDSRLLVLYFDFQGMPVEDQIRAQEGAVKFLTTQMTAADRVAIMSYTGQLKVLHDFSDDRDSLIRTVRGLVLGEASEMANVVSDESAEDTGAAFTADESEFNIFNTDRQLTALGQALKMLGSLPEKKALVYFASGIARSGIDNDAQLRATINTALRSNVSIYPVDARGLVAMAPAGNANRGSGGGAGNRGNFSGGAGRSMMSNLSGSQDTLYALAADTGGKAFLDSNDLAMGVAQAQRDIASYYILGYYSTNTAMDGKYRRIKVQINNNLSAKLDYRTGYFASKEFKQFTASDRERQLEEALMLGDPITDLTLALEVAYFRLAADRYYVPVTVKMPGSDLELAKRGGSQSTRLDYICQVRDTRGRLVASARDFITVKLKEDTAADLSKKTVAYDVGFALQPGTYTLKFLTRENETGKMGTFETRFTVPDLTKDVGMLPISAVVLSNQREKLDNAIGNAGLNRRMFSFNPLVRGGEKLVPSVTRVFRKDQQMYVFLEAYEPNAETTQPLVATLGLYRGKVKAFETEPVRITEGLHPLTKAVPVRFSFPLEKLEPGRYICQVNVINPSAGRFAYWRAPIIVLP
ncbi:MAG: VWA domain-containing protein [Bryobacteraceae bacterium]|nr:VWA domain-containing protein [Bryobacteraceae bacterium]